MKLNTELALGQLQGGGKVQPDTPNILSNMIFGGGAPSFFQTPSGGGNLPIPE